VPEQADRCKSSPHQNPGYIQAGRRAVPDMDSKRAVEIVLVMSSRPDERYKSCSVSPRACDHSTARQTRALSEDLTRCLLHVSTIVRNSKNQTYHACSSSLHTSSLISVVASLCSHTTPESAVPSRSCQELDAVASPPKWRID
jgi:hypothetical protein